MTPINVILKNAVHCHECNTLIESLHRHDFKYCNCPEGSQTRIAVDGGLVYIKRSMGSNANYEELSETKTEFCACDSSEGFTCVYHD